jgi:hypothetical protein
MFTNNQTGWKKQMDDLVERTRAGIAMHGVHVIYGDELAIIWNPHQPMSDFEKRLRLENFAAHHGLAVYLNTNSNVGIFRKSD